MGQTNTTPIDPMVIQAALDSAASLYDCQRGGCHCGNGPEAIRRISEALDHHGIDHATARAFAHGVGAAHALFADAAKYLDVTDIKSAALLITETLRRSGDITDADIALACERYRMRMGGTEQILAEGLRQAKERFGQFPIAPGSARNN